MSFEGTRSVLIKDLSGNTLSVAGGSLSATANISGQPITLTGASGFNPVYITNQSGNLTLSVVAGNGFGDNLSFSTSVMTLSAVELFGLDTVAGTWGRLRTTASGSIPSQAGAQYRLLVDATEGGTTFRTRISGYLPITDASGGASVGSGVCAYGITLQNISGSVNGVIWVGGSGTNLSPFSGHGRPMLTGDELTVRATNFLQLRAVANISGVLLAATGVDF